MASLTDLNSIDYDLEHDNALIDVSKTLAALHQAANNTIRVFQYPTFYGTAASPLPAIL